MDYKYHATAERIIDGDTFLARVDLGFYIFTTIHVRIRGMNAPEMTGASRVAGAAARTYLAELLELPFLLQSYKDVRSFERWVCDVWHYNGQSIADMMVERGQAVRM